MPTGLEAQGTLAPVSTEGHRNRVRRQLQGTLRRTKQQDALTDVVYGAAKRGSQNQYMLDLGELAQSIGGDAGRDFFKNHQWYQSVFEKPSPIPKPDRGFLGRMGARFSDGTVLAQMGRVGARALVGDLTTEEAKAMEQELRGRMSNMEWLQHARGVGPEIERQLAAFGEMAGMQADILVNEAGIAALAGVALGSPGGPPLMAAAGLTGLKAGFAAGNMGMMAGLEYLDLLDQRIELEDGTQVPIPDPVARATAGAVGVVNGVIEYMQWAMVPGGGRVIAKARDVAEQALSRMMREGTLRRLTTRAMLVGGFAGAAENVQEIAQEVGSAIASEIALDIAESQVGGVRVDGVPLGEAIRRRVGDVLSVSGGIALMGVPSGVRSFMGASRARATTSAQPDELFDRALMSQAQAVPMGDFQNLGPVSPRARALAEERVRAAQAGEAPLLPIQAQTVIAVPQARGEGVIAVAPGEGQVEAAPEPSISVPAEADRALVEVLRQFGSPYVPATLLLPDGAPAGEVTAAGPGAPPKTPDFQSGRPADQPQALRRDPAAFDELWHQVRAASSVSAVSDEQVTAAAIVMEGAAINAGLSIREWMDRRFPNGLAMSPEQAARAVQAGETAEPAPPPREPPVPEAQGDTVVVPDEDPEELRRQMYDALPPEVREALSRGILQALGAGDPRVAEAQRTGLLDGGRLTELGMWAESRARDEARAEEVAAAAEPQTVLATPAAPAADPGWTTVDPIRLELPQVWPDEQGPAVIAWEGADGMLQVVGGHARADLMRRMRAAGEFEAPVQVLRADDGWTLDEAQRRGPEFSKRTADTALIDVARTIRGLPLDEALAASLPLDRRRTYQALGLAQLGDVAWNLVEAGDVPAEHGAWVGILAEDHNLQHQIAESFAADPAESEYEAESRVRLRLRFGIDRSTPLARAFDQARMSEDAGDLQELAQQLAQRGGPLHQAANLEHLSEGEVWGRALHYWLSGAAPDLHLRSARSADDLLGFLRHLLLEVPAEQEAAAEPEAAPEEAASSADELARAMFVRRFRQGDTVERPGGEQGTVVIDDAGVPLVRIGETLEPVAARTASRWRRVERPADEIEEAPEGATPPAGPQLEAMLSLQVSDFVSSIAGEPDSEPVVRALVRAFDDAAAIPEFVAAARARLQEFVGRREEGRWTINELQPWRKYNRSRRWWFDLPDEQRQRDAEEARAERLAGGETITPGEQRMVAGVESALEAVEAPPEPTAEDAETELVSREAEDLHRTARRDWVASLLRQEPRRMFQRAYHVSPYKFDRFSTDFIGSGEGAQAYGHGLYFATSEEVKRHYEQSLRPFVGTFDGSPFGGDDVGSIADALLPEGSHREREALWYALRRMGDGDAVPLGPLEIVEETLGAEVVSADGVAVGHVRSAEFNMWSAHVFGSQEIFNEYDEALEWAREEAAAVSRALQVIDANQGRFDVARGGATYEVDLAPAEEDYLLWDEPLSAQSDQVKAALATLGIEQGGSPFSAAGSSIYGQMALDERDAVDVSQVDDDFAEGQRLASRRLLEAGIRGIKYQDWATRNQGQEGGYNYVIFSGDDVSIVQRMEQRRVVPGGEQAAKLIEQVVDELGIADNPAEAGHVLPDGRFLNRGEAARTPTFMEQTGAARMDGRVIEAAHPLTAEQIAAILAASDEGVYELVAGEQRMKTTEPLNADTLLSHFARGRAPTAVTDVEVLGVTEVDAAGRVQIALTEGADFDTLMEELFHVFRLDLPQDQEAVLGAWAGAQENPDGSWTWNEQAEETFARGAIQYLREGDRGRVPDAIRSVFQKIRDWLRRLYAGIRLQMPDDVRRAYEDLLLGSERPEVLAFERLQRAMHDKRERVEFTDGDNQVVVQRMKRGWVVDQLDDDGERLARREHQDMEDALRDVAGVATVRTPVPIGNPDFREAGPPNTAYLPEASPETNDLLLGDVADAEDEQTPPSGSVVRVDPTLLRSDPQRFQAFEDEERRLPDDTRVWSPLFSGQMVVWQDNDGQMWVVDGHQRVELAQRLAERNQPVPPVNALIYHEADTTAEQVRLFAALKNLVEGVDTEEQVSQVLQEVEQALEAGTIDPELVRAAGTEARTEEVIRLFQTRRTPAESRDVGRRAARSQDISTVETAAGQRPRTEEPAGGHTWASARATLRKAVSGARNRAAAVARREAVDAVLRAANLGPESVTGTGDTRQAVNRAARDAVREAQVQATEREARRAAAAGNLREGRDRVRRIQRSLREILRGSRTIPEPLRTELRQLVAALDIDRVGRMTTRRLQPDQQGEVDPLRLLAAIDAVLIEEDSTLQGFVEGFEPGREAPPSPRLPGANPNIGPDTTLRDMSLLDLERLHRRILAAVNIVRKGQAAQQQQRRETMRQEVAEVAGELAQTRVALSNRVPRIIGGAVELLGISSERPNFFLERVTGMASRTYDVFWRRVKSGTQTERRLHERVTNEYIQGLRAIGIDMTGPKFEAWLNERMEAPGAAAAIKPQWTRAEVMSFAMTWADPYAREHLTEGGLVIVDDPLKAEPVELGLKEVTEEAAGDLIGLLGDQERAMIGDDGPIRALFEHLFYEQNKTFRDINGYDLEKWQSWYPVHVARAYIPDTLPDGSALGHFQHGRGEGGTAPYSGFLEFRTGDKKPISIRPISTEVNSAIRHTAAYVGLEPALRTARSALYNPRVQTLLERQGKVAPKYLERYLQGVAHNSLPPDRMEGALNTLRQNVTVATLASPAVSMKQALSYAVAAMHVPERYLGMALADLARPGAAKAARDRHRAMDPDFAVRLNRGFDIDIANRGSRQAMPESRSATARRHARFLDAMMWGLSAVDQWTVTRVEQAAVNHAMDALAEGTMSKRMQEVLALEPEQAQALPADRRLQLAYSWANWVVARTQPSHLPENLSDMQRRRGLRLFTSFSGYTNVAANSVRSSMRHLMQEKSVEAAKEAAWATMGIMVIGPLGAAIFNRLRDIAYGRDEDERTPILVDAAMGIAAMAYFVRDAGYAASQGFGYGSGWEPPVVEAVWNVGKGIDRVIGAMGSGDNVAAAMLSLSSDGLRLIGMPVGALRGHGRGLGELTGILDD